MSNFFAALDDSGDEGEKRITKPAAKKKVEVVEPSKPDRRKQPNHGDRNTKGGRGGRAPTREGKRAYDRRSGTGRGKEIKKGGGGARNWGNDKADARKMEGAIDEEEQAKNNKSSEEANEEEEEKEPEVVVEDKTISYEEFMANKEKPKSDAFASIQVREVENEFANLKTASKGGQEDFLVMGGGKQKRTREKKEGKKTVESGFKVAASTPQSQDRRGGRRDGGDRRDRRGGGGNRRDNRGRDSGRGGGRGGGQKKASVDVADTNAFPSL